MTRTLLHRLVLVSLAILPAWPAHAGQIDSDGGITLTVAFEDSKDHVPVEAPGAETHYCNAFKEFSEELFQTTEGKHWIKRVRFFSAFGSFKRDVAWNFHISATSNDSYANSSRILLREKGQDPPDYLGNPRKSPASLGRLLDHEMGHFFYGLPDEYVNFNDYRGGGTGFCRDSYTVTDGEADGDICDEETQCDLGDPCIFKGECIEGDPQRIGQPCGADLITACSLETTDDMAGQPCITDMDCPPNNGDEDDGLCLEGCGPGGICLGANGTRDDQHDDSTIRICLKHTNVSLGTGDATMDKACLMYGSGRRRWCDGGKENGQQVAGATHVYRSPAGSTYGGNLNFDLGNLPGVPVEETENGITDDFLAHSCWAKAQKRHADLIPAHKTGEPYTDFGPNPPVPPTTCDWLVDPLSGLNTHAALLLDKSGSMSYMDKSDPPRPALDLALDAAVFIYNEIIPGGNYGGVYNFDTATTPAVSDGSDLDFDVKASDLEGIDNAGAFGGTNIAEALRVAIDDILASAAPLAVRNIILFTDGKHNDLGDDPYEEAERACNNNIFVHTIAYGNADSAALDLLSKCAPSWIAGTMDANDPGYAEPDTLELKSAMARMALLIEGQVEVLETRAPLEPLTTSVVETRSFVVPQGAESLTFTWLGDRTCVLADGTPESDCEPVLNLLTTVEIESPTGVAHPAVLTPGAAGGVYRTIDIAAPEAGTWTARVDKTEPVPVPSMIPGEWDNKVDGARVVWLTHVKHDDLEVQAWVEDRRRPLDAPVVIKAQLMRGAWLSRLRATSTVTHAGQSWSLRMFDDGRHFDEGPGDGTYAAVFNPDGDWVGLTPGGYRVKVRMEAREGESLGVAWGEPDEEDGPVFELYPDPGDVTVEAETSFRLAARYSLDPDGKTVPGSAVFSCPDLVRGQTYPGLVASVQGIEVDMDTTRLAIGPDVDVTLTGATCTDCAETSSDPGGTITFDVTVQSDATTGPQPLWVQQQLDIVKAAGVCRVCSSTGVEDCNGRDDDCNGLVDDDPAGEDTDADGLFNVCDNCPGAANPDQSDFDGDGQGDRCDTDDGMLHVRFTSGVRMEWDLEGGSAMWNGYRGDLDALRLTGEYTQAPGSNALAERFCGLPAPLLDDTTVPAAGKVAFYLFAPVSAVGPEGSLGLDSNDVERPNDNPCPGGPPV